MSLTLPIRDVIHSWAGYRALPSSRFETLAPSSAAELVGVARPRCGGSVTRESDISNGENGDISIGGLHLGPRAAWNKDRGGGCEGDQGEAVHVGTPPSFRSLRSSGPEPMNTGRTPVKTDGVHRFRALAALAPE